MFRSQASLVKSIHWNGQNNSALHSIQSIHSIPSIHSLHSIQSNFPSNLPLNRKLARHASTVSIYSVMSLSKRNALTSRVMRSSDALHQCSRAKSSNSSSVPIMPMVPKFQMVQSRAYSEGAETKFYSKDEHRKMLSLVRAWRQYAHPCADLDPLGMTQPTSTEKIFELKPAVHGLQEILDEEAKGGTRVFNVGVQVQVGGKSTASLTEIIQHMKHVYANKTAAQFYHLESLKEIEWISKCMERVDPLEADEQVLAHNLMLESQIFDMFLQKKFPTTKRYGLEGTETFVPVMDAIFRHLNKNGFDDAVLGMPHRGRNNLLIGLLGFPPRAMFHKIKGNLELPEEFHGSGDVLSHLGIKSNLDYGAEKPISITLLNNPSHLEAVNPVTIGNCRAHQHIKAKKSAAILVHGDSAVCSQGVVAETLQLSKLPHFTVGGTIHIIVNNQLGFTTAPKHYRSTKYSGDIGKMIAAPVFSVNAEHIEDVLRVVKLATEYKCKFGKDVFVEIMGYRRYGHNELDESSFTQPLMYKNIRSRERYPDMYSKQLISSGLMKSEDVSSIISKRQDFLENEYEAIDTYVPQKNIFNIGIEDEFRSKGKNLDIPETGYDIDKLIVIGRESVALPENFVVHPRLLKSHVEARVKRIESPPEENQIDWALGEALAVGSLLQEGYNVRICGQDASRGTFSQRHFKFIDQDNEQRHFSFADLSEKKGFFEVVSSPLSEYGVLGFEFGYSIGDSKTLVVFENQFGDFQNCAQVVFDNFIANAEDKWGMASGITCLLPHGMDGAGPDHSSSRMERFLQMCDNNINTDDRSSRKTNMYVVNPSTPAQYFHLLRRQMIQKYRKPLIVISPKILLRLPAAQSKLTEMAPGTKFHPVLPDLVPPHKNMKRLILCTGKIFYDLHHAREVNKMEENIALVRIEELAPFPYAELEAIVSTYQEAGVSFESVVWAQEEHENQGAYTYVAPRLQALLQQLNVKKLQYIGRSSLSSSAIGNGKLHKIQTQEIYDNALQREIV